MTIGYRSGEMEAESITETTPRFSRPVYGLSLVGCTLYVSIFSALELNLMMRNRCTINNL